jgi:hypothetical protein
MLATILPLCTAYPNRPDVREALEEARVALAVDLRAARVWESGLYQRSDIRPLLAGAGVRRWSSAVSAT